MSLVFELPLPENLGNHRLHWRVKNERKKAYYERLDALVLAKLLPRMPDFPMQKAEAEVQMRTWRRADLDNCYSRLKWVGDWLETRGYIQNDRDLTYRLDARVACRADLGITLVLREVA